jgi:hypothetical protein
MPVYNYCMVLRLALYCCLAYCALRVSLLEREVGNKELCRYHQISAVLYTLLGTAQAIGG